MAAGWEGLLIELALITSIIVLSVIKPLHRFSKLLKEIGKTEEAVESIEEGLDPRRTTYVRIQKPKALIMGLRIGGMMRGAAWKDVTVERYDTHPDGALEWAVEDYDGYRISHYCEQHPDAEIEEPLEEINELAWIEVNPEQDLPDE